MEAIVEYNYTAQELDELTIRKGDIITDIKVMLGGWWEGTLRDKRGMFPDNFVKVLEPSSTGTAGSTGSAGSDAVSSGKSEEVSLRNGESTRRFCKVLHNYEPCYEDELALEQQDWIEFLGEVEEGWWRGRLKGKVGVFPSNFVSPPVYEEPGKHKDREKKEICKALFPYEAVNKDELTLNEGDIITLLSTDAPDKGWWIGELKGQMGLFPDNFVEIIGVKSDHQDPEQWHELPAKSLTKHSHQPKKSEKVHVRKSLDIRNLHTENKKPISASSTSATSPGIGGGSIERKSLGGHSIISNIKRLVGDATNNGNGNNSVALGEELDGVERGEGAPLSHLTASRAKAPRRRPPSSQRLRRHAAGPTTTSTTTSLDENLANGTTDSALDQLREDEPEGLAAKARRKAPWVEELKMNQLERRKIASVDRVDRAERVDRVEKEVKKERYPRSTPPYVAEPVSRPDGESEESKSKDKSPKLDTSPHLEQPTTVASGTPAYVPYSLYNQLLERVAALEEKQGILQQTLEQLTEQLGKPLSTIMSITSPD